MDVDRGRQSEAVWLRPALRRVVQKVLIARIGQKASVLEVGAGAGELLLLSEGLLPAGVCWISSDHQPRSGQIRGTLPDLAEIPSGFADVIAELSVADTIPERTLVDSFSGMCRTLKPGGVVVRILDLREQSAVLGHDSAQGGLLPMLYSSLEPDGRTFARMLVLLDRNRLRSHLPALRQRLSTNALEKVKSWLGAEGGLLSNEDPPQQRDALLALFRDFKILVAEMDLATYAEKRLRDAMREANRSGAKLDMEFCGTVSEETIVPRETLPGLPKRTAAIASRYGLIRVWTTDPFGPHSDRFVRVRANAIVLAARKS